MATAVKKTARTPAKTPTAEAKTKPSASEAASPVDALTDGARAQFEKLFTEFNDNADAMRSQAEEIFATVRENMDTTSEQFKSLNEEFVSAARDEVADAVEFTNELSRAKTVVDALEIQRNYWTNLFESRLERTRDLTDSSVEAARKSFTPMSEVFAASFKTTPIESFAKPMESLIR